MPFGKSKGILNRLNLLVDFNDRNLPVLLISNHISWWDGFWAMYINLKVLKRKFHFMMLEEQLRKYWFFNYTGGFSVNKKSKVFLKHSIIRRNCFKTKKIWF